MGPLRVANLHVMVVCVKCGGVLEDRWKFCIFCGTPVPTAPADTSPPDSAQADSDADGGPGAAPSPGDRPARPPIPSAIRTFVPVEIPNEDDDDPAADHVRPRSRSRRVDIPLLLGIALGVAGVAFIVYIAAVLSGQG